MAHTLTGPALALSLTLWPWPWLAVSGLGLGLGLLVSGLGLGLCLGLVTRGFVNIPERSCRRESARRSVQFDRHCL